MNVSVLSLSIVMSKVERWCRQGVLILAKDNNIVSKGAEIRNRYNQVPHLTQDTNDSQLDTTNESQEASPSEQTTRSFHFFKNEFKAYFLSTKYIWLKENKP